MPTLRIQYPEKDSPSTLVLDAPKITVGRRADNTVQIVDRTISAFHAELVREDDHYRLHDLGSTNGTRVNGEPVTDYHLKETCKISFGPVECEFSPEVVQGASVETLPTRIEIDAVRRENVELKARIETLQQELESLREMSTARGADADANLLQDQLQRLVRERAELQDAAQYREREFTALKTELARMNRDRQNLQDALSQAHAEIANLKQTGEQNAPAAAPKAQEPQQPPTPAPAAEPAAPQPAGIAALPKPTSVAAAQSAPQEPVRPSTPTAPAAAPTPVPRPAAVPKPVARPAVAASGNAPVPRVIAQPPVKVTATPRPNAGPSGTQKISIPSQASGASAAAKPLPRPLPRQIGQVPGATGASPLKSPGSSGNLQE